MTWIDLVAWSPSVYKKLKSLCTKVPKKRAPKANAPTQPTQPAQATQALFQPVFFQQVPQMPVAPQGFPVGFQPIPQFQPAQTYQYAQQPLQAQTGIDQAQTSQQSTQQTLRSSLIASYSASVLALEAERHTRFLRTLVDKEKAFQVEALAKKGDGSEVSLEKAKTQADQGSDMNVVSMGLVRHFELALHKLSDIGFKGLSMRTADHCNTELEFWIWLTISVAGIWRSIRCFVAPEVVSVDKTERFEHFGLILGNPWLYSVDASFSIRQSTISIGDALIGEEVRRIVSPEIVFFKDHNLLMYPKSALESA